MYCDEGITMKISYGCNQLPSTLPCKNHHLCRDHCKWPGLVCFPDWLIKFFLTASHAIAFLKKKRKTIEFCHRLVTEALVKKFVAGHSCVQYLLFTDGREPSGNQREGWKPGIKAELTWGQGDGGGIHLWEWNSDTLQTAPCILYHCLWQLKHCLMWKACWLRVRFHCPLAWG